YVHAFAHRRIESGKAILVACATGMALHDQAVVARDAVEVSVDHRLHQFAWHAFRLRHAALLRQGCAQHVEIEGRVAAVARTDIALARNEPFGFGHLVALHLQAQRHNGFFLAHHHGAVVARLALHRVEIAALHGAECRHVLPYTLAFRNYHGVFRLPETGPQIPLRRVVRDNRVEIHVQMRGEATAVAVLRSRSGAEQQRGGEYACTTYRIHSLTSSNAYEGYCWSCSMSVRNERSSQLYSSKGSGDTY